MTEDAKPWDAFVADDDPPTDDVPAPAEPAPVVVFTLDRHDKAVAYVERTIVAMAAAHEQWGEAAEAGDPLAADEIELAKEAVEAAFDLLARVIAELITNGSLHRGDRIRSPYWFDHDPLIVASVEGAGARELTTVVLTADGARIRVDRHDFEVDPETHVVVPDETPPGRFERWWGVSGLSVAGTYHPVSRGMLDIQITR